MTVPALEEALQASEERVRKRQERYQSHKERWEQMLAKQGFTVEWLAFTQNVSMAAEFRDEAVRTEAPLQLRLRREIKAATTPPLSLSSLAHSLASCLARPWLNRRAAGAAARAGYGSLQDMEAAAPEGVAQQNAQAVGRLQWPSTSSAGLGAQP